MKIFRILPIILLALSLTGCPFFDDNNGTNDTTVTPPTVVQTLPKELLSAFGADPTKEDTDGDGLKDEFEIKKGYPFIKPDLADTDGNGITDDKEDIDSDGLTSLQEQQYGTDNISKDSDNDGLSDGEEVLTYKTNPLVADTDGDGIPDGREVVNGSNPLIADADKVVTSKNTDVVIDPDTGAESRVSVSLVGAGDLAGNLEVKGASDTKVVGQVGKQYDITFDGADLSKMQSAEVTLPYDPVDPEATDTTQLVVATINPTTGIWELLPSTVDTVNNTVTAKTSHFSNYTLMNSQTYMQYVSKIPQTCDAITDPDAVPADVALVIDSSGSMSWNDPSNIRLSAARAFVSNMKATDQVAVVDFDDSVRLAIGLSSDKTAVSNAINTIDSSGGTNIGAGVSVALQQLKNSDASKIRAIILLTDGEGDYDTTLTAQLADKGIRVFTIGLGSSIDTALLTNIANSTGGKYKQITDASGLTGIFKEFSSVFGDDGTDTDKDGLTDCQETQGVYTAALGVVKTDPNNPDSDGDEILDSVELGTPTHTALSTATPWVSTAFSNPNAIDSDGDGLSDPEENAIGTFPLSKDSDSDGLSDKAELEVYFTLPDDRDTDGDTLDDRYEILNADKGFDPLIFDQKRDSEWWDKFWDGLVYGDIHEIETVPQVVGQLVSGVLIIGDFRDYFALMRKEDYFGAGVTAVGLIPWGGDAVKVTSASTKLILKKPALLKPLIKEARIRFGDDVANIIADTVPDAIRQVANNKTAIWKIGNHFTRGKELEVLYAARTDLLPSTYKRYFGTTPIIDAYGINEFGQKVAISFKSLDFTLDSYANPAKVAARVRKYASELKNSLTKYPNGIPAYYYEGGEIVRDSVKDIDAYQLDIAFPGQLTQELIDTLSVVKNEFPNINIRYIMDL